MEITEKTRFNFNGEKMVGAFVAVFLVAWALHLYITKQTERDDRQDNKIDLVTAKVVSLEQEFKASSIEINNKLDRIIEKQAIDHDIVIRHEYSKINENK